MDENYQDFAGAFQDQQRFNSIFGRMETRSEKVEPMTREKGMAIVREFCLKAREAGIRMGFDQGKEGVRLVSRMPDGEVVAGPVRSSRALALWAMAQEHLWQGRVL